jgi:predicted permease
VTNLFGTVAPVFALIGMGAIAVRRRLIEPAAVRGMTDFVFFAAMPSLLFASVAAAPPLRLLDIAGSFLAGALILFAIAMQLARAALGARLAHASLFALNAVFGNTLMLGIPIVDAAYGREGVAYLLAIIALHAAVLLPTAMIFVEADRGAGRAGLGALGAAASGTLRNPVIISILLALLWRSTGLALPGPLARFLGLLGAAGPPLALFCLGATLPRAGGSWAAREVALASALKLVALPALVATLAHLAGVRGTAFSVVVVAAGLPTGANAFLLARRFDTMTETSASTVVVTTTISIVTLTLLLAGLPR